MDHSKLAIILSHSPPCELANWAKEDVFAQRLTSDREFLMKLSVNLGLPFCDNIEEIGLLDTIPKGELLIRACEANDLRVAEIVLKTHEISQDYILKAAIACIQNGNLELFKLLPQDNLDFGSLLNISILAGNTRAVEMVLDRGIRPNLDSFRHATDTDNEEIVELLMTYKDNLDSEVEYQETITIRGSKVLKLFLDNSMSEFINVALTILRCNSLEVIDMLVQGEVCTYDDILLYSIFASRLDCMGHALDRGATNIDDALVESAMDGANDELSFLLENGAMSLQEALHQAILDCGDIKTVQLLLKYGAVIDDRAIEIARGRKRCGEPDIIDYLESADV